MRWVRRRRRTILLLLGIAALVGMTLGYLKRIGIDPLAPADEAAEER
jgi:hypothetical protein